MNGNIAVRARLHVYTLSLTTFQASALKDASKSEHRAQQEQQDLEIPWNHLNWAILNFSRKVVNVCV